jgi:hypothetical protein
MGQVSEATIAWRGRKCRSANSAEAHTYTFGLRLAAATVMTYRVTFMERTGVTGEPSEAPTDYVAIDLADGVVLEKLFIDRTEPDALHSEEALEEDDSFLSVGSETWDYEIADGREDEFLAALKNSQMVMEYVRLDEEPSAA